MSFLVGIDGSERGERALEWASRQVDRESGSLTLISVIDPLFIQAAGGDGDGLLASVDAKLHEFEAAILERYPDMDTSTVVAVGKTVDCLVDEADKHDVIVMGSHHGMHVGRTVAGAKGLRVSVSAAVPTVLVPVDWDAQAEASGIVVGVGPDDSSDAAVAFGVRRALVSGCRLKLVSAWGLPALLSHSAEAMGGGLAPVGEQFQAALDARVRVLREQYPQLEVTGEAIEGSSPTRVLEAESRGCALLVLGTHSRAMLGRTLFGSVSHSVLQNLQVPTVVVPQL